MREKFIIKFLETVKDIIVDIGVGWSQIPYKGVRYSRSKIYNSIDRKEYYGFRNLESRRLIRSVDNEHFVFTKHGQKWLSKSFSKYFKIKNKGNWDKKWRIVIFDIPQELHNERTRFRRKLKSLGFAMLQKSVFAFPYPCEEEVGYICEGLGVSNYIDVIIAESIGSREKELLKIFHL